MGFLNRLFGRSSDHPSITPIFQADMRRAQRAEARYQQSGDLQALEEAVTAWECILNHPHFIVLELNSRLGIFNDSGAAYFLRYQAKGHMEDLDRALALWQEVVVQAPAGLPKRAGTLSNLGAGLSERYARTGALADLEAAIKAYEQAVAQTMPGSPELPGHLNNLGTGLSDRYARTGELSDLRAAIQAFEQAVAKTPPRSPDLPMFLSNLGLGLRDHYARTGELAGLEKAIRALEQAVAKTSPGSPERAAMLNNLGLGLKDHYACTGALADLEAAIQAYEQAVAQTMPGSPELPRHLTNLGLGLRARYARTGDLADLGRAIKAYEEAVAKTPPRSPERTAMLNNLGNGLSDRYARTGELADLEGAIKVCEEAVAKTPPHSPGLPIFLNNLGLGLRDHYARMGELADLDRAIQVFDQAVAQTMPGSPELPRCLNNLSIVLMDRYGRTGKLADLEQAIKACEQAAEKTMPSSPSLPGRLNNLGNWLRERYARTGALADLKAAIDTWEHAWRVLQTTFVAMPVTYKLGQQREWAGLNVRLVAALLQRAEVSPSLATTARRRAMEIAEGSKSRLLTELVGRGDIPAPLAIPPKHAAREGELLDALTALDTVELADYSSPATPQEEAGRLERLRRRGQCLQELQRLWEAMAQSGPEAADYVALRRGDPPAWDGLACLAADLGPKPALLSLFTAGDRTLLFILREGWEAPAVVEADLDGDALVDIWRRFWREVHAYDGTDRRGETWDRSLRPLLEKAAVHLAGVERIIFAPQAWGHLLPWAVVAWRAGWRGPDGLLLPLVTLPALGLLPRLRRRPVSRSGGALVAGNPLGDLKYAEEEAREVAKMLGTTPLIGSQATKAAVLARLAEASLVHLATHAYFAAGSPLDSGILLADGILTAREVMSHRLQTDLLVLSACQTGMVQTLGGDELAGLAQAFLQAGARSLLVSLWAVDDPATAALMTAFYTARQTGADKARALSQAMAQVRTQAKWSHIYYWGAFALVGDW